jgi:uncharacterized protein YwgA
MEPRLIALKLFLDFLEIPTDIETVDDRKKVQKAIYLGQLTGVDLGYRFGWYLMGPYSTSLTKDYYALAESLVSDKEYEKKSLKRAIADKLSNIKPLFIKPPNVPDDISQEDWLELIASYHYLKVIQKYDEKDTKTILQKEKPKLFPYIRIVKNELDKYKSFIPIQ